MKQLAESNKLNLSLSGSKTNLVFMVDGIIKWNLDISSIDQKILAQELINALKIDLQILSDGLIKCKDSHLDLILLLENKNSFSDLVLFSKQISHFLKKEQTPSSWIGREDTIVNPLSMVAKGTQALFPEFAKDIDNLSYHNPLKWFQTAFEGMRQGVNFLTYLPDKFIAPLFDATIATAGWNSISKEKKQGLVFNKIVEIVMKSEFLLKYLVPDYYKCISHIKTYNKCESYLKDFKKMIIQVIDNNIDKMNFNPVKNKIVFPKLMRFVFSRIAMKNVLQEKVFPTGYKLNKHEEFQMSQAAENIVADYGICFMNNATTDSELSHCDDNFYKSVYYRSAREILKLQLSQKISCELPPNMYQVIQVNVLKEFEQCSLEYYFPLYKKIELPLKEKDSLALETNSKRCVFAALAQAVHSTVDMKVIKAIDEKLPDITKDNKVLLYKMGETTIDACLKKNKVVTSGLKRINIDYASVGKISVNNFESIISECIKEATIIISRNISKEIILNDTGFTESFNDVTRKRALDVVLKSGFDQCLALFPNSDVNNCADYIESVAVKEVIKQRLTDEVHMLIPENELEARDSTIVAVNLEVDQCSQDLYTSIAKDIYAYNLAIHNNPKCKKNATQCPRQKKSESCQLKSLHFKKDLLTSCLERGITTLAGKVSKQVILKNLSARKEVGNINLNELAFYLYENNIEECFQHKLKCSHDDLKIMSESKKSKKCEGQNTSIEMVESKVALAKKVCTQIITNNVTREIVPLVLDKEIDKALENKDLYFLQQEIDELKLVKVISEHLDRIAHLVNIKNEKIAAIAELKKSILKDLTPIINEELKSDHIKINYIKYETTLAIIRKLVENYLNIYFPGDENEARRKTLFKDFFPSGFDQQLKNVIKGPEKESDDFITSFKLRATRKITLLVIENQINQNLPKKLHGDLIATVQKRFDDCLALKIIASNNCSSFIIKYLTQKIFEKIAFDKVESFSYLDSALDKLPEELEDYLRMNIESFLSQKVNPAKLAARNKVQQCMSPIGSKMSKDHFFKMVDGCVALGILELTTGMFQIINNYILEYIPNYRGKYAIVHKGLKKIKKNINKAHAINLNCLKKIQTDILPQGLNGNNDNEFLEAMIIKNYDHSWVQKQAEKCSDNLSFIAGDYSLW